MENIVLIGMPGCGKSTIGVVLAKSLGYNFIDTDLVIQSRENKLLQQIIDEEGIERFCQAEEEAILSLQELKSCVIATGGSAVYSQKAMAHLMGNSKIIYLRLECETVKSRLTNIKTRGVAIKKSQTIEDIYKARTPLYEEFSQLIIDGENKSVEQVLEEILAKL